MQNAWLPLQHLDRPPINVGGLCYFYFTPIQDVLQWPDINPLTGSFTDSVVLKAGKTWYRCDVINPKRSYSEKQSSQEAGSYMECQVSGFLPDDLPNASYSANEMKYHRYAIVLKERNGIMRLIGNQFYGADFNYTYDSGDDSNARGRNISFSWLSEDSAPLYLTATAANGNIINPPWVPPASGGGSGRMIYDPQYFSALEGQTDFTFSSLVGKTVLLVSVPPVTYYPGSLQTQFTFTSATGTIKFNYPLHSTDRGIILYADPI